MTSTELAGLSTALAPYWQALHAPDHTAWRDGGTRRRAPGGGRKAKLDLADRVLATVLHQRLGLSPAVLARLFTVSKDTIREATGEIGQLMDQHGHTPPGPWRRTWAPSPGSSSTPPHTASPSRHRRNPHLDSLQALTSRHCGGLRVRTPPSTAREPRASRTPPPSSDQWPS